MSQTLEISAVRSGGVELDTSPEKFGELRDSSDIAFNSEALRERVEQDGYLFLPGLLDRDEVLAARADVAARLHKTGHLMPGTDPLDCVANPDCNLTFWPELALNNEPLMRVLYEGPMMDFYERLLGEPVKHFDFTWFRAVAPGASTYPHTDAVYMNRGTQNLFTSWTPLGDLSREHGGLMVLENSHLHDKLRAGYSSKDVDTFCENKPGRSPFSGKNVGVRAGGSLSDNPYRLREAMGGRWLTSEFRAGDLLMFSIYTVHASIENTSNQIRLSSDSRYQRASEPADERWIGPNPPAHGPNAKRGLIC
ncbi:MAG TPA: phytanoyl-CoA dioxygenase family protein [Abditibacterium sp.]|jgi:hypothetical protein